MKPALVLVVFAVLAVGLWVHVAYRVAHGGWSDLVSKYRAARPPSGKKVGAVSGRFPRSSYSSSLVVWFADEGFFIRPSVLFCSFHPALLIPWAHVVSVCEEKKLFEVDPDRWTADRVN